MDIITSSYGTISSSKKKVTLNITDDEEMSRIINIHDNVEKFDEKTEEMLNINRIL